jgi:hypothetical protein
MIEYLLLIIWLIAAGLYLSKKDWFLCILGAILMGYLCFQLYNGYPALYGSEVFLWASMIFGLAGVVNAIRKVL